MLMPMLADDADDATYSLRHPDALHHMQVAEDDSDDVKDEMTTTTYNVGNDDAKENDFDTYDNFTFFI